MTKLAIIIPALNEEKKIRQVITSIPKHFERIDEINIIVVDDGSTDATLEQIKDLDIKIIKHHQNEGLGRSFRDGLEKSLELKANYLVNIDGDGQFDPQDIGKILAPIIRGEADFVTASRFIDKNLTPKMPLFKLSGNRLMSGLVSWILRKKYYDVSCGFRGYNLKAMLRLNLFGRFTYTQETFLDLGFKGLRIVEVPVAVKYFADRRSRVAENLLKYSWRSIKIIFRAFRDYKPLKFFGMISVAIFIFGFLFDLILFFHYMSTGSLSPYKIFGFVGAFFNILGIIIFTLGLIADMLYRLRLNQEEMLFYEKERRHKS